MKHSMFLLIGVFCYNLSAHAQDGWIWQNPLPQGNDLLSVHMIDENTGFAVGRFGTLLKTTNGGTTWSIRPIQIEIPWEDPPTQRITEDLRSVYFVTNDVGWIVGMGSLILKTTDGGMTWMMQEAPGGFDPNNPFAFPDIYHSYSVHFADLNTGWAVGHKNYIENNESKTAGSILMTTDGGETWTDQPSGTEHWLFQVLSMDANTAWAVGGDWNAAVLLKTTDGGATWNREDTPKQRALQCITFLDPNLGWIAGWDFVLKTMDGGVSWTSYDVATLGSLKSIAFTDENNGWIAASVNVDQGGIFQTTDGGENWNEIQSESYYNLNSVSFESGGTGWIVGDYGTILKTTGNGTQWDLHSTERFEHLYSTYFNDTHTGWAVGDNAAIYQTTDGGNSWTAQNSGLAHPDWASLNAVCFVDDQNGWAVGVDAWLGNADPILKTTDGGANWIQQNSQSNDGLLSVCFINATTGWIVGYSAKIYRTTDGGATWNAQDHPFAGTVKTLESVHFIDANRGWIAAGHEGKILHTSDGGANWIEQNSGTTEWLYSVFFIDQSVGWMVGSDGIFKTTDGGEHWVEKTPPDSWYNFDAIRFADANVGYAIGGNDILKTTDGGETWSEETHMTNNALNAVFLADPNLAWVVGDGGTIIHWKASVPNEPPVIVNLNDFGFLNTETYTIDLDSCVTDPDHTPGEMTWQITPSDASLKVTFSNHHVNFSAPDWSGPVDVLFIVTDPAGASDTLNVKATVNWPASVADLANQTPQWFSLNHNYPNPFNPRTTVIFGLPVTSEVKVEVLNIKGESVAVLIQEEKPAGYYSVIWEASENSAGTYFIRMEAGHFVQVRKCLLMK